MRCLQAALAAVLLALLSACTAQPPLRSQLAAGGAPSVELAGTPFFPQEEFQCGPAALATVLAAAGAAVTPEELAPQVYLPGRHGSLQPELLAAARRHGRVPYPLAADPAAFLAEVAAGNPVLLLQNLGSRYLPAWHYAVLVGYDAAEDRAILRSGTVERLAMAWPRFVATTRRAGHWGVVVLEPGRLPATAEPRPYVAAVAGLESAGRHEAALRAYEAGLARWPAEPLLWLGQGNAAHAGGDVATALASYRRAVELAPANAAARHNLAQALLEAGCPQAAQREARSARPVAEGTALQAAVEDLVARAQLAAAASPADPEACAGPGPGPAPDP